MHMSEKTELNSSGVSSRVCDCVCMTVEIKAGDEPFPKTRSAPDRREWGLSGELTIQTLKIGPK